MEYTSTIAYISSTKSPRELKLVPNWYRTMFYNSVIRYTVKMACNKIYGKNGYLNAQYLRELQILEKNNI